MKWNKMNGIFIKSGEYCKGIASSWLIDDYVYSFFSYFSLVLCEMGNKMDRDQLPRNRFILTTLKVYSATARGLGQDQTRCVRWKQKINFKLSAFFCFNKLLLSLMFIKQKLYLGTDRYYFIPMLEVFSLYFKGATLFCFALFEELFQFNCFLYLWIDNNISNLKLIMIIVDKGI